MLKLIEGYPQGVKPNNVYELSLKNIFGIGRIQDWEELTPVAPKEVIKKLENGNKCDKTDGTDEGFINCLAYGTNEVTSVGELCNAFSALALALRNPSVHLTEKGYVTLTQVFNDPMATKKDVERALIIEFVRKNIFHNGGTDSYVSLKVTREAHGQMKSAITLAIMEKLVSQARKMDWDRLVNVKAFAEDMDYGKDDVVELSIDSTKNPPDEWYVALLKAIMATILVQYTKGGEDGTPMLEIITINGEKVLKSEFVHTGSFMLKRWCQDETQAQAIANDGVPVLKWINPKGEACYFYWAVCINDDINGLLGAMAKYGQECVSAIHDAMDVAPVIPKKLMVIADMDKTGNAQYAAQLASAISVRLYPYQKELDTKVAELGRVDPDVKLQVERDAKAITSKLIEAMCAEVRLRAGETEPEVLGSKLFLQSIRRGQDKASTLLRNFPQEKFLLAQAVVDGSTRWTSDKIVSVVEGITITEGLKVNVPVKGTRLFSGEKEIGRTETEIPAGKYELHQQRRVTNQGTYVTEWFACRNIRETVKIPEYTGKTTLFCSTPRKTAIGLKRLAKQLIGKTLTISKGQILLDNAPIMVPFATGNNNQKKLSLWHIPDAYGQNARQAHYEGRKGVVTWTYVAERQKQDDGTKQYELAVLLEDVETPQKFRKLAPSKFAFEPPKVVEIAAVEIVEDENHGEMSDEEKAEYMAEHSDEHFGYGNDDPDFPSNKDLEFAHNSWLGDEHNGDGGSNDNGGSGSDNNNSGNDSGVNINSLLEGVEFVSDEALDSLLEGVERVSDKDLELLLARGRS